MNQDRKPIVSSVQTIGEFIGTRKFAPAAIQRDFNWEASNCAELYDDIYRLFSQVHKLESEQTELGQSDEKNDEALDEDGEEEQDVGRAAALNEAKKPDPLPTLQSYLLGPGLYGCDR